MSGLEPIILGALASAGSAAATAAPWIGTAAAVGGTLFTGLRASQNSQIEAKLGKQRGDEELAVAQRDSMQKRREGNLLQSRARAVAAASGGSVADATVQDILAGIGNETEYNAQAELYMGRQKRANYYTDAALTRQAGKDAFTSSIIDAAGTAFSGVSSRRRASASGKLKPYGPSANSMGARYYG